MRKENNQKLNLKKVTLTDLNHRLNAEELGRILGGGDTDECTIDTSPPTSYGTVIRVFC